MEYILKGFLIGLIFGVPAGAVGALTVQRTMTNGFKAGIFTGMGSSVADVFYASVGAFGITVISNFILKNQTIINAIGSVLIAVMGVSMFIKTPKKAAAKDEIKTIPKMLLSSLAVGITNPAAILSFIFAFSFMGINGTLGALNGILLVLGVFAGTMFWWTALAGITTVFRNKFRDSGMKKLNVVFGIILLLFAISVLIKTFSGI